MNKFRWYTPSIYYELRSILCFVDRMKRICLLWYGPYSVADLLETFKQSVIFSDEKYPALNNFGFYMYLDQSLSRSVYIGQASDGSPRSLRNRIRWEITKDGIGCALSQFSKDCQESDIDKLSLVLKLAHIKEATDDGNQIQIDLNLMNDVEMALIHEQRKTVINKRGKKRYRGRSIEILNSGNFAPLPEIIRK